MMEPIYLADAARTPFLRSGTDYIDLMSFQLGAAAIAGVLNNASLAPFHVDAVIFGNVLQDARTSNPAREAALTANIPASAPCHTVSQACISANQAIASGIRMIRTGEAGLVVAGGVDTASDPPILFPRRMRRKLLLAQRMRTLGERMRFIFSLRPSDFTPQKPAIAEYLTGRTMGEDCELLARRYAIDRQSQDAFAARSHHCAARAWGAGRFNSSIAPVTLPDGRVIKLDNGFRADTSEEKLSRLNPAFQKNGTLTAGNASFLTDGAAAVLLASAQAMDTHGLKPLARIIDYTFTGQDIWEELLLGPAFAVRTLLRRNKMKFSDMDVLEFHEAFAAQVLANIRALTDAEFAGDFGDFPYERLNCWGGSLALGHPFGATGARILMQAACRLEAEKGTYALIAACAAGGHGHAMLLRRD